jgi:hypothetical protein
MSHLGVCSPAVRRSSVPMRVLGISASNWWPIVASEAGPFATPTQHFLLPHNAKPTVTPGCIGEYVPLTHCSRVSDLHGASKGQLVTPHLPLRALPQLQLCLYRRHRCMLYVLMVHR